MPVAAGPSEYKGKVMDACNKLQLDSSKLEIVVILHLQL